MESGDKVYRTVAVKLELDSERRQQLLETIEQYRWAANYVVTAAWPDGNDRPDSTGRTELHHRTYDSIREDSALHSSHVALARDRAIEAMKSVLEQRDKGVKFGKPEFTADFLDYNSRCATISEDHASLATTDGRARAGFVIPSESSSPHQKYLLNAAFEPCRSTLVLDDGTMYLHVVLERVTDVPEYQPERPTILGVDLGISNVAVSSTGRFWDGDKLTHWRNEYAQRRRSLQQCGSRWAHENIQTLSKRVRGRVEQYLHSVANEIISEAVENGCTVIAFEDLSYIHEQIQHWDHIRSWAYRLLVDYVTYKGETEGVSVAEVDPENTSRRCSTCGHIDPGNRPSQERFECIECGYENHADYNAAKNIGLKHHQHCQNDSNGSAPVGVRLNSGIITDEEYIELSEAERANYPR